MNKKNWNLLCFWLVWLCCHIQSCDVIWGESWEKRQFSIKFHVNYIFVKMRKWICVFIQFLVAVLTSTTAITTITDVKTATLIRNAAVTTHFVLVVFIYIKYTHKRKCIAVYPPMVSINRLVAILLYPK